VSEQCVPQAYLLSPIPFLFHNAYFIDACNSPDLPATGIGFVEGANVLAFGKSTEETCSVLKEIHSCCLTWGDMHGASFAPLKYVLIHFPKKKRNLPTTPLELLTFTLQPSTYACVLGVIIDSKLSWHPHLSHIKSKLRTQTFVLTRLTSSTGGAPFYSCCLLYTFIVCLTITYASSAWYSPLEMPYACKYVPTDFMHLQSNRLSAISGA
jgi:hypothetical protein